MSIFMLRHTVMIRKPKVDWAEVIEMQRGIEKEVMPRG